MSRIHSRLLVLTFTAAFPAAVRGEDAPGPRPFGPPPGTRTEYDIATDSAGESETITIFRLPGAEDAEAVILDPSGTPLTFLEPGEDGPSAAGAPLRVDPLFGTIDARGLAPGAAWDGEETVFLGMGPKAVRVRHSSEAVEGASGAIRVRSRLVAPEEMGLLGYRFVLGEWKRDLVLDRAGLRPLEVRLEMEVESLGPGAKETGAARKTAAFRERAHRALARDEVASLEAEVRLLKRVLAATASRRSGGGGLLSLFLGRPKAAPADPLALLAEYEKAHPEGLLAAGVEPLRAQARSAIEAGEKARAAGERRAKLIGSPAPDFTLEDLDGKKKVSLSDFRGKAVLLAFWGYG